MSAHHKKADDEFMRRSFDALYAGIGWLASVHWRELPHNIRQSWLDIHENVRRILKIEFLLLSLTILLSIGALMLVRAWEAANRPTLVERMEVTLPLDARLIPEAPLAWPQQVSNWSLSSGMAPAQPMNAITSCMLSMTTETLSCGLTVTATWAENTAYAQAEGANRMSVTAVQVGDMAKQSLYELYLQARRVGRVGSFALMDALEVTYLTTFIDNEWQFSWTHEGWLYSVSAANYAELARFVEVFTY